MGNKKTLTGIFNARKMGKMREDQRGTVSFCIHEVRREKILFLLLTLKANNE